MPPHITMFVGYPGEILKEEYMDYHGISNEEMAKKTGMAVETMDGIVNGTIPITAELSKMIAKVVKVDDNSYFRMQESFDKRLDQLQQAIIETGNPTTMSEYNRQATILVAMSLLEFSKNNRKKAEFRPLYLQIITFLIDQEVSIDESPIFEHEKHVHGPNDHNINITMGRLIQEGFIEMKLPKGQKAWVSKNGKRRRNSNRRYTINSDGMKLSKILLDITEEQVNDIGNIVNMAMNMSVSQLKEYVCEKYPDMPPRIITWSNGMIGSFGD